MRWPSRLWAFCKLLPYPTVAGLLLIVGSAIALYAQYARVGDRLLWVVSILGLVLPTLAVVTVISVALFLRLRIQRQMLAVPFPLYCGEKAGTNLVLPWLTHVANLRIRWEKPEALACIEGRREMVTPSRRGLSDRIIRSIIVTDHLGLAKIQWSDMATPGDAIEIRPCKSSPSGEWERIRSVSGGEEWSAEGKAEGDLTEIGQYRRGDAMSRILWKLVARTGGRRMYVRKPETVGDMRVALYFLAGDGDDANAELLFHILNEELQDNCFFCGFSTSKDTATTRDSATRELLKSGNAVGEPGISLEDFQVEAARQKIGCCIVFVPALYCDQAQQEYLRESLGSPETRVPLQFKVAYRAEEKMDADERQRNITQSTAVFLSHWSDNNVQLVEMTARS